LLREAREAFEAAGASDSEIKRRQATSAADSHLDRWLTDRAVAYIRAERENYLASMTQEGASAAEVQVEREKFAADPSPAYLAEVKGKLKQAVYSGSNGEAFELPNPRTAVDFRRHRQIPTNLYPPGVSRW
jgi:hypothetical protein